MRIIAADIGGTKSWLCLADTNESATGITIKHEQLYASADFGDFDALLTQFLEDAKADSSQTTDVMCLALPGVIKQHQAQLTNLDWQLDSNDLQQHYNIRQVNFVNDFQAAAMGVGTLQKDDIITLNDATVKTDAITVVTGAGTGLGLAWMDNSQRQVKLFDTEGGHIDFAPTTAQQIDLLRFLQQQYAHVSYERILSGSGLQQCYRFVNKGATDTKIASEITKLAEQEDSAATAALRLFIEIYAAYIGNLALLYKPAGGIYIAGGIATHILPWMQGETFIQHYLHKGRMEKLAARTPIYLIMNKRLGLQGAIQLAQEIHL